MGPLLALLLLPAAASAGSDERIRPVLAELRLGDTLEEVQSIYPPATDWPSWKDPRGGVKRYKIERHMAKAFPTWTQVLHLGFKRGKLVEIQVIYDAKRSRDKPHEELAADLSLHYGEPQRDNDRIWWSDGETVLRVFLAEIPAVKEGERVVEWRTAMQILREDLYRRAD
ncbi:MAG: hypothetical protein SF051_11315 [Elusimicrobiota bacterium]|nr:hypothetical protein [Elusimicrobiota bacterium]